MGPKAPSVINARYLLGIAKYGNPQANSVRSIVREAELPSRLNCDSQRVSPFRAYPLVGSWNRRLGWDRVWCFQFLEPGFCEARFSVAWQGGWMTRCGFAQSLCVKLVRSFGQEGKWPFVITFLLGIIHDFKVKSMIFIKSVCHNLILSQ